MRAGYWSPNSAANAETVLGGGADVPQSGSDLLPSPCGWGSADCPHEVHDALLVHPLGPNLFDGVGHTPEAVGADLNTLSTARMSTSVRYGGRLDLGDPHWSGRPYATIASGINAHVRRHHGGVWHAARSACRFNPVVDLHTGC